MNDKDYKTTCTVPEPVEDTTVGASTSSATEGKTTRLLTFVISLLSLAFFASSCSTQRNLDKSSLKPLSANQIIREIEDNQFEFESLETKIGVSLKSNNKLGLKGQMRIQKDSVIWISLSLKLGIEVGRIMITPDSIKYINRNTRTYLVESFDFFNEMLPLESSIQFFQDLLVGNDTQIKRSDKCRVSSDNNKYKLEITKKDNNIIKDVWVTDKTFKISKYKIRDLNTESISLQLRYDEFQDINGRLMPTKIIFDVKKTSEQSNMEFSVEINYSDIKVGEQLNFPFNISPKFEQLLLW